ncbi:MAG: WD40/YVTN/BNR-like repeat-containing protein, partial [Planctomycetaceae bacterium]
MINRTLFAAAVAALLPTATPAAAQRPSTLVPGVTDSAVLAELRPRNIGPAVMSGRISDIAVAQEADDRPGMRLGRIMYAASAGGGVWKTVNGGKTWEPVFEDEGASSIGDVAIAPSNPDIVWVGTGESNNLRSSSWGDGIYKSTDAGVTWTHMGLRGTQHIA